MKHFLGKSVGVAFVAAIALLIATPQAQAQLVSKQELKCADQLGKGSAKLSKTYAKSMAKCLDADISLKTVGVCPDAKGQDKINKIAGKLVDKATSECGSVCSVSTDVPCITDRLCPPLPLVNAPEGSQEQCTAGAALIEFDMINLGFPGPFCATELGKDVDTSTEIGECVDGVTQAISQDMIDLIYGSITSASAIGADAAKCLASISKASQKLSGTIVKGVSKCRSCISKTPDKCPFNPDTCQVDDVKLAGKIAKSKTKLADTINKKCASDALIVELDLCGEGQGSVTTKADAIDCLTDAISEVSDTSLPAALRQYAGRNIVDAAYPAGPICGDDVINQLPSISQHIGEECDGNDDSACPGLCLPPGDPFQCTCPSGGGIPKRVRFLADGATADLDNGWTGASHNNGVTQNAGYTLLYTGCDCDDMDGNSCIGSTGDPVCDSAGRQQPTCTWDPLGATRCDDHGGDTIGAAGPGGDGQDSDLDCAICDSFAANAGAFCEGSADCQGQCYDAGGTPVGLCPNGQVDCGSGEICRGSCDKTQQCIILTNGAPLPISSEGTAVCVRTEFRENVFGTMNVVTGEHESFIQQFSVVHFEGANPTKPCPLCGGFCVGGSASTEGTICTGTCDTSGDRCRFDTDCPMGETCTEDSPDCIAGGVCNLSLVCSDGPNKGEGCDVNAQTDFGTTSNGCPPDSFKNISGQGLEINFFPQTSEINFRPNPSVPPGTGTPGYDCTAPGFENFRCACPDLGGQPMKPNRCAFTCDAGAEFGIGCGTATDGAGFATKCTDTLKACDEDHDCPAGTCSANPTHCINGADFGKSCSSDGDCDGSLGSCTDACPSGRCTQVCVGGEDGDPEEGFCIGGSSPQPYLCSGKSALSCTQADSEASCASTCSTAGTPCTGIDECPSGETCDGICDRSAPCESGSDAIFGTDDDIPFAGTCAIAAARCFTAPVIGEGGDIFNQQCVNTGFQGTPCTSDADCGGVVGGCYFSDSTNIRTASTFCIAGTTSDAINGTAGLPGPGRLRQRGFNATNGFTTLP